MFRNILGLYTLVTQLGQPKCLQTLPNVPQKLKSSLAENQFSTYVL